MSFDRGGSSQQRPSQRLVRHNTRGRWVGWGQLGVKTPFPGHTPPYVERAGSGAVNRHTVS